MVDRVKRKDHITIEFHDFVFIEIKSKNLSYSKIRAWRSWKIETFTFSLNENDAQKYLHRNHCLSKRLVDMYAHMQHYMRHCHTYINDKNVDRYNFQNKYILVHVHIHIYLYKNARKSQNKRSQNNRIPRFWRNEIKELIVLEKRLEDS